MNLLNKLDTHHRISIQFNFYKTGQWDTEEVTLIVDQKEITLENTGDIGIACNGWDNYTSQKVEYKGNHSSRSLLIIVKSKANIDIRKWSIGQCPDASYLDENKQICLECLPGCQTCTNYNQCQQCSSGFFLHSKTKCLQECPDQYYGNQSNKTCQSCPKGCQKCNSSTTCVQCNNQSFSASDLCLSCKNPNQLIDQNNQCITCQINGCKTYNKVKCICDEYEEEYKCNNIKYLQNCSQQYYLNNKCICQKCQNNKFLFEEACLSECPVGYGQNISTQTCDRCQLNQCSICSSDYQKCSKCNDGSLYYKNTNECLIGTTCKESYFIKQNQCLPCNNSCQTCVREETCTKCQSNYTIMQYFIPDSTTQGTQLSCFENPTTQTNMKQICFQTLPVLSPNNQQVAPKLYTNDQQQIICTKNCPLGYGYDSIEQTCSKCLSNCSDCSSNYLKCSSCSANYFFQERNGQIVCVNRCDQDYYIYYSNNYCVKECPEGYKVTSNNKNECLPCQDAQCQQCDAQQKCSKCKNNKFLNASTNQCLDTCPPYYYSTDDKQCYQCNSNCKSCEQFSNNCSSCKDGFYIYYDPNQQVFSCVRNCPEFYYIKGSNCERCPSDNCMKCNTSGVCEVCAKNYMLYNGQCEKCPSLNILIDNQCQYCRDKLLRIEDGNCIFKVECSEGYFIENGLCKKCGQQNEDCTESNSQEEINKCSNYGYGYGKCKSCNGVGKYFHQGMCKPCPEGCKTCNDQGVCQSCISNNYCYVFSLKQCRKITSDLSCDDMNKQKCQQYSDGNHGYCFKCSEVSTKHCIICDSNSYLFNSECLKKCPATYFADKNIYEEKFIYSGVCRPFCLKSYKHEEQEFCFYCPNTCQCEQLTDSVMISKLNQNYRCLTCAEGYYKIQVSQEYPDIQKCIQTCPQRYYLDQQTLHCRKCKEECESCEVGNQCITCNPGYFYQASNKQCVYDCLDGYFKDNYLKQCIQCEEKNCIQCTSATNCTKCNSTNNLYLGKCIERCPDEYYSQMDSDKNLNCEPCIKNCKICSSSSICDVCLENNYSEDDGKRCVSQCSEGFELINIDNTQKCLKKCNINQYRPQNKDTCSPCQEGCETCDNQGYCSVCQIGYKYNEISRLCEKCIVSNCKQCNQDINQCQECQNNYLLVQDLKQCLDKCPEGYYDQFVNINLKKCIKCINNCISCSTEGTCQSCSSGYYIDQNKVCQQCDKNCKTCVNKSTECTSCNSDLILNENSCKQDCHYSCLTCSGQGISECMTCNETRSFYLNRCVCKEGFIEQSSSICKKDDSQNTGITVLQNGMTGLSTILVASGMSFPSSVKGIDISSMLSFITYSNIQFDGKSDQYLQILYSDNISPLIPNFIVSSLSENNQQDNAKHTDKRNRLLSEKVMVSQEYESDYRFMKNSKTSNFLINVAPLLTLYAIFGFVLLIKYLVFRYSQLNDNTSKIVTWIKFNIRSTILLLIFYLSYQELLLITLLQLNSLFKGGLLSIISSIISLISIIFIVLMIYIITKVIFLTPYLSFQEKAEKYGPLFQGLKEQQAAYIFIIVRITQKTLICAVTVFGQNSNIILSYLIITCLALIFEFVVRPFRSIIASCVSLLLNGVYFLVLLFTILIQQHQDNIDQKQAFSNHLENTLLAFIILKNSAIILELIIFILAIFRRFRAKTGILNESQLQNTTFDLEGYLQREVKWRNNILKEDKSLSKQATNIMIDEDRQEDKQNPSLNGLKRNSISKDLFTDQL